MVPPRRASLPGAPGADRKRRAGSQGRHLPANRLQIEGDVRQQVGLGDDRHRGPGEDGRVLERLVVPLGHRQQGDLEVLPQVVGGRADQVTDVLHEQDVGGILLPGLDFLEDLTGIQVAGAAGQNLPGRHAQPADPVGIPLGGDIPLQDGEPQAALQRLDGAFQKGGFPRAR
jgi:hypothetical protein